MKTASSNSQCVHKTKNVHSHKMSTITEKETTDLYVVVYITICLKSYIHFLIKFLLHIYIGIGGFYLVLL